MSACAAHHALIIGGQKSGKTAHAEQCAAQWLAACSTHRALYVATAQASDDEMRQRIERHRTQRALRVPAMETLQASDAQHAIALLRTHSASQVAIVFDCLTLWLAQQMFPHGAHAAPQPAANLDAAVDALLAALRACAGPLYIVSNEIGLGLIPLGRDVRAYVDALGMLNQRVAAQCSHVSLMAAGLPLALKPSAPACMG